MNKVSNKFLQFNFILICIALLSSAYAKPNKVKVDFDLEALKSYTQGLMSDHPEYQVKAQAYLDQISSYQDLLSQKASSSNDSEKSNLSDEIKAFQLKAALSSPEFDQSPILFTSHAPDKAGTHSYLPPKDFFIKDGAALKVLDPQTAKVRTLVSAPQGVIRRPCVHFDGKKIIFAMAKDVNGACHIYEIEVNPSTLFTEEKELSPKQLTFGSDVYDVDPIYLPNDKIAFVSNRDLKTVPCDQQLVPQIFRMDNDGANIHQLTRSTVHEMELSLTPDGRILYSRWDYVDRNFGDGHGFWVTNPDGVNQAIVWGNNTTNPDAPWTARAIPGTSKYICIFGNHHGSLGGVMAIIDPSKGVDGVQSIDRTWPENRINAYKNVRPEDGDYGQSFYKLWPKEAQKMRETSHHYTMHAWNDAHKHVKPWYDCPFPLSESHFIYSRANRRKIGAALYVTDLKGNEIKIHEDIMGAYHPMPLKASPRPVSIASPRDYGNKPGHFYIQNVYEGTHMKNVDKGSVKSIRVVEALSKRGQSNFYWKALGHQNGQIGWSNFLAKSVLGTAPVEVDGSASFLVPSDKFVYFQLLDKDGMMIQNHAYWDFHSLWRKSRLYWLSRIPHECFRYGWQK